MKYKTGDIVKFTDDIWEVKKATGMVGEFFSEPLTDSSKNRFTVAAGKTAAEEGPEYRLAEYPFLVYEHELEPVKEEKQLKNPRCFYHIRRGDMYIVWWKSNAPKFKDGWVRIPEFVWNRLSKLR